MNASSVSLKVWAGFALALIAVGGMGLGIVYYVTDLVELVGQTRRIHRNALALENIRSALATLELGARPEGGRRDPRANVDVIQRRIQSHFETLDQQAVFFPQDRMPLDELKHQVGKKLAEVAADQTSGRAGGGDAARFSTLTPVVNGLFDNQERALEAAELNSRQLASQVFTFVGLVSVGLTLLVMTFLLLVNKDVARRLEVEAALKLAHDSLEERVAERTDELASANAVLRSEVQERQRAEQELQKARTQLEERVAQRTAELGKTNEELRREIRERSKAARALRETTVLQQAILDSANYAIVSTEADGTIRTFNAAAERWLAYREKEVVGRQPVTLFHLPEELNEREMTLGHELGLPIDPGFEVLVTRARLGVPDEQEWTYVRKDGTRFPVQLSVTALRDEVEDISGFLVIGSDITERKKQQEELRRAKEAAESANRSKSEFLANMSHELRTPLNSVIGFTTILLKNKASNLRDQDLVFLGRVLDNGKHLLGLINQILDLAKVEAGRLELEMTSVGLASLVQETLALMEGHVKDKDVALVSELPPGIAPLHADAGKLKQVLINLIGNAIKFTEHGQVLVRVETNPRTGRPLALEVRDTGIGIAPEKLATIFEAFQQADVSTTRKYGGTGLGLTIARSLCQLMGYEIKVTSKVGEGSQFRVTFTPVDLRLAAVPVEEERQQLRVRPTGEIFPIHKSPSLSETLAPCLEQGKSVLVIDDDSDSRLLLTQYIEDCGCRVVAVGSGQEGLHYAKEFRPDLIVLDLMMPGMSGWDVLKQLKSLPGLSHVPVVVVSIVARENRGSILGAVDLLDKPVSREALGEMLRRNLLTRKGPALRALVVDDNEDARRLASSYLAEAGYEIREAMHGQEALAILEDFRPDLIILDLMMPVMDGMTFLENLRQNPLNLQLPVVVLTAKDLTLHEIERLRTEATAVLRKGDDLAAGLRTVVREVLAQP